VPARFLQSATDLNPKPREVLHDRMRELNWEHKNLSLNRETLHQLFSIVAPLNLQKVIYLIQNNWTRHKPKSSR